MIGARCIRLNVQSVLVIVLCVFLNGIKFSTPGMFLSIGSLCWDYLSCSNDDPYQILIILFKAVNHMEVPSKYEMHKNNSHTDYVTMVSGHRVPHPRTHFYSQLKQRSEIFVNFFHFSIQHLIYHSVQSILNAKHCQCLV